MNGYIVNKTSKLIRSCFAGNVNAVRLELELYDKEIDDSLVNDISTAIVQNFNVDIIRLFVEDGRFYFYDSVLQLFTMFGKFDLFEYMLDNAKIKYVEYNVIRIVHSLMSSNRIRLVFKVLDDVDVNNVLTYDGLSWMLASACDLMRHTVVDRLLEYDELVYNLDLTVLRNKDAYVVERLMEKFGCDFNELKVILVVI